MKILITGASGLIGSALSAELQQQGHKVSHLVRCEPANPDKEIFWSPLENRIDEDRLEGFDAVVHLAGENIAEGKWTDEKKSRIRNSRIKGTQLLCATLSGLRKPPSVLVSASATGYYGNRGDEELTERSGPGSGFIAELCQQWEEAVRPAKEVGIRVVVVRLGLVLTPNGGALAKMLTPFRAGMGGKIGNGKQYVSWITLSDCIEAIKYLLQDNHISGPVNLVAPSSVTNAEFTKTLGKVLNRPSVMSVPKFIVRRMFGEMADELLLASERVIPIVLSKSKFKFRHTDLETALRELLSKG